MLSDNNCWQNLILLLEYTLIDISQTFKKNEMFVVLHFSLFSKTQECSTTFTRFKFIYVCDVVLEFCDFSKSICMGFYIL